MYIVLILLILTLVFKIQTHLDFYHNLIINSINIDFNIINQLTFKFQIFISKQLNS
jgi:hypothetical protein